MCFSEFPWSQTMTSDSQGLTSAGLRQCKRGETLLMCPNVKEFKTWFFSFPLSELTFMGEGRRRGAVQLPADLQWPALLLNLATCVIHNEMGGLCGIVTCSFHLIYSQLLFLLLLPISVSSCRHSTNGWMGRNVKKNVAYRYLMLHTCKIKYL